MVWRAPGGAPPLTYYLRTGGVAVPFVLERPSITPARPQEPSPRSRVRPVVSQRWGHAHSGRLRGLGRLWLWYGALLGAHHRLRTGVVARAPEHHSGWGRRTSGVAVLFVLERRSNTPARPHGSRLSGRRRPQPRITKCINSCCASRMQLKVDGYLAQLE